MPTSGRSRMSSRSDVERAGAQLRVGVQGEHVRGAPLTDGGVRGRRESEVPVVRDQADVREPLAHELHRAVV